MSKALSPTVIAAAAVVIGLVAGFGLGYAYFQPRLADVQIEKSRLEVLLSTTNASLSEALRDLADKEVELAGKEAELEDKKAELAGLLKDLQSARERIATLEKEIAVMNVTLQGEIAVMNATVAAQEGKIAALEEEISTREEKISKIEKAAFKLDNDGKLLIYLRMELPETRQDALNYWEYVKNISVSSDARLGPLVDKIIFYIDSYFDWFERLPSPDAPQEEWDAWLLEYYRTDAVEYGLAIDEFTKEVYLVIVTHIKEAVELVG